MRFAYTYSLFTFTYSLGLFTARYIFPYKRMFMLWNSTKERTNERKDQPEFRLEILRNVL